jgi:hypothetical protein
MVFVNSLLKDFFLLNSPPLSHFNNNYRHNAHQYSGTWPVTPYKPAGKNKLPEQDYYFYRLAIALTFPYIRPRLRIGKNGKKGKDNH